MSTNETVMRDRVISARASCNPSNSAIDKPADECHRDINVLSDVDEIPRASGATTPSKVMQLYGARFDFPARHVGEPSSEYMLATLPRSGSTYLALELWRTGLMGAPMEYPNPHFSYPMRRRLGIEQKDFSEFWVCVKRLRTSPNGIFGYKMFTANYLHWAQTVPAILSKITPRRVILLTRTNLVEQAISYSRAIRSGSWFADVRGRALVEYDADHIEKCLALILYQLQFWNELLSLSGAQVHKVSYEALMINPRLVLHRIGDFLGVELKSESVIDLPQIDIQRNSESAAWVKRFLGERSV